MEYTKTQTILDDRVHIFKTTTDVSQYIRDIIELEETITAEYLSQYMYRFDEDVTEILSHKLRFQYDIFASLPILDTIRDQYVQAFISTPHERGKYALHGWANVGYVGDSIGWHNHITSYYGFSYIYTSGSTTEIRMKDETPSHTIDGEDGVFVIAPGRITPHRTSVWDNDSHPRITLAFNIIKLDGNAVHDRQYISLLKPGLGLYKFDA